MKQKDFTPHYSIIQCLYWMANSVLVSYAAVYLGDKGFSNGSIGIVLALASLFAVIIQPLIAAYIDKSDEISIKQGAVYVCMITATASLMMSIFQVNIRVIPILYVCVYMFFATLQPLISSLGMECENYGNKINFGLARGLGSWGYALLTVVMGYYLLRFYSSTIPVIYLILFSVLLLFIFTFNYKDIRTNKEENSEDDIAHTNIIEYAKCYPEFMWFLVGVACIFYGHALVNNFAINLFENVGGNSSDMGVGLGLSAFLELPAMVFVTKFKDKINVKLMLIVSAIAFFARHFLFWIASSVAMLLIVEAFQLLAYAVFAAASIYYINGLMGHRDAVKGQSYSVIALTIGGIFSSLIGGQMIDLFGLKAALGVGALITAIGSVIMIVALLSKGDKKRNG